jgi:hypothetical protein
VKAFLMHRDSDFELQQELPVNETVLAQDLELDRLFRAMALGDEFLIEVARKAVLSSLDDPDAIVYRQHILRDCLEQPAVVRDLYDIALEAIQGEKKVYIGMFSRSPDSVLRRSVEVLQLFVGMLERLRHVADEHAGEFRSEGLTRLFRMLATELDDEYLESVEDHLSHLRFRPGVLISAELGEGNKGTGYVLRRPLQQSRMERIFAWRRTAYAFRIADGCGSPQGTSCGLGEDVRDVASKVDALQFA